METRGYKVNQFDPESPGTNGSPFQETKKKNSKPKYINYSLKNLESSSKSFYSMWLEMVVLLPLLQVVERFISTCNLNNKPLVLSPITTLKKFH